MNKQELISKINFHIQWNLIGDDEYTKGKRWAFEQVLEYAKELKEPETLSQKWIENHRVSTVDPSKTYVAEDDLQNLLVPEQEEVDRAYKDGYEKGKQHTFYKGYLEGLADKENEPETVADVIADFYKSLERLKEVLGTEVKEIEE